MNEFVDNIVDMKFKNWAVYVFHKKKYSGLIKKKKKVQIGNERYLEPSQFIFSLHLMVFLVCVKEETRLKIVLTP